jgi:4-amino-4-deoxy-L-arabinose transferase-like glycosyltransferase
MGGAISSGTAPDPSPARSRLLIWRSPPGQPAWARPALLCVAALAALSYAWSIANVSLEIFYGAAVRSMSESWHNFFFGSFDPWGTISVDKLPGAFWVQALSLRLFGFHLWAIALPQVVEGTLTVLVLYRAVRRVAGPAAGLAAAIVLAASPVTILLNRGNISDSLLILLVVLAADAATAAFITGRLSSLVMAGVWVGLAFQAKMLQAWLVLPGISMAYVLAAPAVSLYRRLGHVLLSTLAVLIVSLSWISVVSIVPAHDRPYVDGSCDNSLFSQVFLYNGADRLDGDLLDQPGCSPPPAPVPLSAARGDTTTVAVARGPARFLGGTLGRDAAWMFFPTMVALFGIVIVRRRHPRADPLRAAAVLWGTTLFFTWCFFASSSFINSYYVAALIPPMATLCALGLSTAWRARQQSWAMPVVLIATVAVSCAYTCSLVPDDAGVRPWVIATTAAVAVSAMGLLGLSLRHRSGGGRFRSAGLATAAAALVMASAWASATVVMAGLGPFDSPYQPAALTARDHADNQRALADWPGLIDFAARVPADVSITTEESSASVSFAILATGREFLPVGGFTGRVPEPTLRQFLVDVRRQRIQLVLVAVHPLTENPDLRWVVTHCRAIATPAVARHVDGRTYQNYYCAPGDAGD